MFSPLFMLFCYRTFWALSWQNSHGTQWQGHNRIRPFNRSTIPCVHCHLEPLNTCYYLLNQVSSKEPSTIAERFYTVLALGGVTSRIVQELFPLILIHFPSMSWEFKVFSRNGWKFRCNRKQDISHAWWILYPISLNQCFHKGLSWVLLEMGPKFTTRAGGWDLGWVPESSERAGMWGSASSWPLSYAQVLF